MNKEDLETVDHGATMLGDGQWGREYSMSVNRKQHPDLLTGSNPGFRLITAVMLAAHGLIHLMGFVLSCAWENLEICATQGRWWSLAPGAALVSVPLVATNLRMALFGLIVDAVLLVLLTVVRFGAGIHGKGEGVGT